MELISTQLQNEDLDIFTKAKLNKKYKDLDSKLVIPFSKE